MDLHFFITKARAFTQIPGASCSGFVCVGYLSLLQLNLSGYQELSVNSSLDSLKALNDRVILICFPELTLRFEAPSLAKRFLILIPGAPSSIPGFHQRYSSGAAASGLFKLEL
jgi:hypothetical protein